MKIAIRVPNWIGDSILALPAIESVHKNFPDAQIWIVTKEWTKDIFTSIDHIQGVRVLPAINRWNSLRHAAMQLNRMEFDTGLLFTNSFGSALLFYLAKIPQRWGYSRDGRQMLLTKKVATKKNGETVHQVYYYLNLLSGLELKPYSPKLNLPVSDEERQSAINLLESCNVNLNKRLFIINPGAYYGPAKRWPVSKYSQLAILMQENFDAEILIIGSPQELPLAKSIVEPMERKPCILAGKTSLSQLINTIGLASLCVTNDSGPMHIANGLRVPTVALFGPTDPTVTGPFQEPSVFIKKDVPCWPCSYRECPFDHRCMMNISSQEVLEACERLLA